MTAATHDWHRPLTRRRPRRVGPLLGGRRRPHRRRRDVAHWRRQPAQLLIGAAVPRADGADVRLPAGRRDGRARRRRLPRVPVPRDARADHGLRAGGDDDRGGHRRRRGVTDRFRSMPMAPSGVVARPLPRRHGRRRSSASRSCWSCGLAIGWRPAGPGGAAAAVGLLLLLRLAFLWIGIYLGPGQPRPGRGDGGADPGVAVRLPVQRVRRHRRRCPAGWRDRRVEPAGGDGRRGPGAVRQPGRRGGGWAAEHAMLLAVGCPVVLSLLFAALSVRRYQALSR